MRKILVIIISFNGRKWLDRCIGSVLDAGVDCFVVDNGSTDGSIEYLRSNYPTVTLIESGRNLGFGQANNIGLKYALDNGYEYAYLLNGDAWMLPGTLEKLTAAFESPEGRNYGILSPVQYTADGKTMDRQFGKKCLRYLSRSNAQVVEVPFVMAAHWMLSRKCFETVGGFSPAFSHNGEDDNYIDRARFHGFKTGIVPQAGAIHDRASRIMSKEASIRLKCVASVVKVSDPNACLGWRKVRQILELCAIGIKNRSFRPFRFIPELIKRYPELEKLRKESMTKGAFLPLNSHHDF